MIPLR
jgi:hypothetical protein